MTDGLLALTTMTASGTACGCGTLAVETPTIPAPMTPGTSAFWAGIIGVEGELTGDGRYIEPNALAWDLPMPLRYVSSDVGEHGGAQVAGRILQAERRPGGLIWAAGDYDMSSDVGTEAERQVREMLTNGVSMDLDDVSFEVRVAADLVAAELSPAPTVLPPANPDGTITVATINASDEVRATTSARIRAATIVAIPAFADAKIYSSDTAPTTSPPTGADMPGMMPDGVTACSTDPTAPDYNPDCVAIPATLAANPFPPKGKGGGPAMDGVMPDGTACVMGPDNPDCKAPTNTNAAIIASATALLAPPAAWFANPSFKMASPLTVTQEGRVFGHLAAWGVCHIGMSHQGCVLAPHSRSGYAYFRTGSIVTAEGTEIPIGHITLSTPHAGPSLSAAAAQAHYENTGAVVADVAAGEDAHGIWVSGALRTRVSADQVRELRAAPLSGDWRRLGGSLELVAALAVNVPGFPIPRPHGLVAGGAVQSLMATGMIPPRMVLTPGTEGALSMDDLLRLKQLAEWHRQDEAKRQVSLLASGSLDTAADLARRVRASSLAMRVHSIR